MVLVPFPGFLYLYICEEFCERTGFEFSSPSRGSYISTIVIAIIILIVTVLVPFPGFLYLYKNEQCNANWTAVLVPFPGFLYLYLTKSNVLKRVSPFSSPSRGSYISTMIKFLKKEKGVVLVPFPGFLYLYKIMLNRNKSYEVLVPFPGFLYLYEISKDEKFIVNVLVPFPGFLYLYKRRLMFTQTATSFSSPSRGSYISTLSSQSLELYTHISAFAAQM